jgi:aspartyl-tRNA(Asn)/glutamyl-tRNA(Gln) amidotransferase subunit A
LFSYSSIEQYHAQLLEGSTTCLQAVEYYLQQIQATQHLNAFIKVYADEVIQKAKQLDSKRKAGDSLEKLHGVVVGLKDVICYKGHDISASSKILKNFTSVYSATAVERLLAEGAIIIGIVMSLQWALPMKILHMAKY